MFNRILICSAAAIGLAAAARAVEIDCFLEYLGSTGTQYIDTGYVFKTKPRVETRAMLMTTSDLDVAGTSAGKVNGCFLVNYKGNAFYYRYGNTSSRTGTSSVSLNGNWVDYVWDNSLYHNGVLMTTETSYAFSANSASFWLFASGRNKSSIRYQEVKMYDGGILVRDLVPVKSGGVAGMYDRQNDVFYANAGSGTFEEGESYQALMEVSGSPDEFGTVSPAYGSVRITESTTSFSLSGAVTFDDGVTAYPSAGGLKRAFFEKATVAPDIGATSVFTTTSFAWTRPSDVSAKEIAVEWSFTNQQVCLSLAKIGAGEADFYINGEPAALGGNWMEETNAVVVTVVPRSGSRFICWTDAPALAATRTNELYAATTMTACVRAADELAADSYVKDGLVLQLDGLENGGTGIHDSSATVWTDLVGSHSLTMPTSRFTWTWDTNSWYVTASDTTVAGGPNVGPIDIDWRNMTMELCVDAVTTNRGNYLCWAETGSGTAKLIAGKSNALSFTAPGLSAVSMNNRTAGTGVATVRDALPRVWQTPDLGSSGSTATSVGSCSSTFYIGCANTYYNDRFLGHFYGLRLYNRALTDHEMRWNAFVDTARYVDPEIDATGKTRVYVEALPLAFGIVPTDGGLSEVTKGTSETRSIADQLVTHAFDSARVSTQDLGTGVRARYTGYTLSEDLSATTTVSSAESVSFATSARTASVSWLFEKEYDFVAFASAGGKIALGDGTAVTSNETWVSAASAVGVRLTAVPDAGYKFFSWKGDLAGVSDATAAVITVTLSAPRTVQALFVPTGEGHVPVETAWKTSVTTGAWNDPANWSAGEMPSLGDTVYLTNGATTTVTIEQPIDVGELVVGGKTTLKVSNWFSQLKATRVRIIDSGTITCVGGFAETEMSNRVWLAGTDLTVASGAKINVQECGYARNNGPCWILAREAGQSVSSGMAASYGGKGDVPTYGSLEYPTDPGSGAYAKQGGGAAFLDFTGTVTIDGTVDASGSSGHSGYIQPGSSGGAVLIKCAKITGSGAVYAGASDPSSRVISHGVPTYCSGGGRIAVHYDPAAQDTVSCHISFLATGGIRSLPTTPRRSDPTTSGVGTLYFTDNRFLTGEDYRESGWRFTGTWNSGTALPSPLVFEGDRSNNFARLEILQKDLAVRIGGDLTIVGGSYFGNIETGLVLGEGASLSVGGDLRVSGSRLELGEGGCVSVTGSLTQETNKLATLWGSECSGASWNGGALVMHAAPTNGTEECGASVSVAGRWTVGTLAAVYPWCQATNGAAVKLTARHFLLESGGRLDADERGYKAGFGPGIPSLATDWISASHGGLGAANNATTSNKLCAVYGVATRPLEAGSGGRVTNTSTGDGEYGGGVVWLEAGREAELYGSISANSVTNRSVNNGSGGSGGSVYLRARKIVADGLDVSVAGGTSTSIPGAGGRIAFDTVTAETNDLSLSVRCGTKYSDKTFVLNSIAEEGTIAWTDTHTRGLVILVR